MGAVFEAGFNGLAEAQPSLPAAWYLDPAQHARELAAIWHRHWIYLCRGEAVADPGAFRVFPIAGQEVLVVRGRDGALRGFHNTCRHRGSALCLEAAGRFERGAILCPYHQWAYGLDGALRSTGRMRPVAGFDRAAHGLLPVAVVEHRGFVFANLDPAAAAEGEAAVALAMNELAAWPFGELVVGHGYTAEIACNWKVFWENFNECLHCPNLHPELCEIVPIYGRAIMGRRDAPDWEGSREDPTPAVSGSLREGAETWSMDGRGLGTLPGLDAGAIDSGQRYAVLMPSMFVAAHADHARVVRLLPLGPERMEISAEWLFHPGALARPGVDLAPITRFGTLVMEQDGAACEWNQRGLRARAFDRGVLMQEEYSVFLFHEWLREALGLPTLSTPEERRSVWEARARPEPQARAGGGG